jgi:hypothetical protein
MIASALGAGMLLLSVGPVRIGATEAVEATAVPACPQSAVA